MTWMGNKSSTEPQSRWAYQVRIFCYRFIPALKSSANRNIYSVLSTDEFVIPDLSLVYLAANWGRWSLNRLDIWYVYSNPVIVTQLSGLNIKSIPQGWKAAVEGPLTHTYDSLPTFLQQMRAPELLMMWTFRWNRWDTTIMGSRHRAHYGYDIFSHYAYAGIKSR